MALESKIFKGVSWMAFFNFFTQCVSWTITIAIARILAPKDYGLYSMATIITGYAMNFSELGLGNAIIQRLEVTQKELSSLFWFLMGITSFLALSCFPISYLTDYVMNEPRVIPITQTVSILFLFNGLQIIPSSLLRKEMNFKSIGLIEMIATIISCFFMLLIAKTGGGVWTLIIGNIFRSILRTALLFFKTKWYPDVHYSFKEAKSFLSFGVTIAVGRSLFYVQEKADKFFAGRAWQSNILGIYTFAQELAQIPTDKIVSLINNVSFPAFSKIQNDKAAFNSMYLNITKVTALFILPLFIGGYLLGGDLIKLILNPKWYPMIPVFKLLCITQIFTGLNAINNFVHAAQGRPNWSLFYNLACAIVMPVSFYFAVKKGLNAIVIPWLTSYLFLTITWIFISLWKLGIPIRKYFINLSSSIIATALMFIVINVSRSYKISLLTNNLLNDYLYLTLSIITGMIVYFTYILMIEKKFILGLKDLMRKEPV